MAVFAHSLWEDATLVTTRPKTVITFRMRGTRVHEARTDLRVRGHSITIDERVESGGTDEGIAPVETLLASLVGCTNRITHKLAARHGVEIKDMVIDLISQYLCQQAKRWAEDNSTALQNADPETPAKLHDRAADNWRPLFAIADRAGGAWPERARQIAVAFLATGDDASIKTQLLADIKDILGDDDRVTSADLTDALAGMEDRPWSEWRNGKPITKTQLARLLKPFGIAPTNIRLAAGSVVKGYVKSNMEDAFTRYLGNQTATTLHPQKSAGYSGNQTATRDSDVAFQNAPKAPENRQCSGVAFQNPGNGRGHTFLPDDDPEERAAIMEFDGRMSRSEAEAIVQPPEIPDFLRR